MLGTNISTLQTLKIDLSDHPFIKDNIFEVNVNFPPRGTPIGIYQNIVNITTCHTYLNWRIKIYVIMYFQLETGQMYGSSALA